MPPTGQDARYTFVGDLRTALKLGACVEPGEWTARGGAMLTMFKGIFVSPHHSVQGQEQMASVNVC